MNSNEVNEVINNLCDKLGLGIQNLSQLVPELAKMNIADDIIWCMGCVLLIAISAWFINFSLKKYKDPEDYGDWEIGVIVGVVFVALVICFATASDMIQWIICPTTKTIKYVLNLLNN